MPNNIILLGYSGHAYSVIDAAQSSGESVEHYCERESVDQNPFELNYLGDEAQLNLDLYKSRYCFFPGIGDNFIREKLIRFIENSQLEQIRIVHQSASVSEQADIGLSTFIGNGALVNPVCSIGKGVIINTGAIIEHECEISDYVHIAPGAVLAGNVSVGKYSLIGANSVIKQGVKIGENCIIGAGSVVLQDIPDNKIVAGNPSRLIKENE